MKKPDAKIKRLFSIKEAAVFLGRSDWSVREMIWSAKLPYVRDGKRIFIDIVDLETWINNNKKVFGN